MEGNSQAFIKCFSCQPSQLIRDEGSKLVQVMQGLKLKNMFLYHRKTPCVDACLSSRHYQLKVEEYKVDITPKTFKIQQMLL
jgi:hypothetical protein